jgi:L-asparagine transporter-like permease
MPRRLNLAAIAATVVGAWILCWWVYHANGGGTYGWFYVVAPVVAGLLSIGAAGAIIRAWRTDGRALVPVVVSIVAVASILLLALALYARGA